MVSVLCRFPALNSLALRAQSHIVLGVTPLLVLGLRWNPLLAVEMGHCHSQVARQSQCPQSTLVVILDLNFCIWPHWFKSTNLPVVTHSETEMNQSEWDTSQLLGPCQFCLLMGLEEV